MRVRILGLTGCLIALVALAPVDRPGTAAGERARQHRHGWYKGNTHAHSLLMLRGVVPHGDSGPAAVARWYRDHGYDFAVISDHNRYSDPTDDSLREIQDDSFILIPGVEVTSDYRLWGAPQDGRQTVHTTALNVAYAPDWSFADMSNAEILNAHDARATAAGGVMIVNHPNYRNRLEVEDLLAVNGLRLIEIYNAHPSARNDAAHDRLSTEATWDQLLSAGKRVYGLAADDAHHFRLPGLLTRDRRNFALPGSAWIMVRAASLSPDAVVEAISDGQFYATTGVMLEDVRADRNSYRISVDMRATTENLSDPYVVEAAPLAADESDGVEIVFIGSGGTILGRSSAAEAELGLLPAYGYVRARITWTQRLGSRLDEAPVSRQFFAWTQPVFLDGRESSERRLLTQAR